MKRVPSSEKWFNAAVEGDFIEMESRRGGGLILWMIGAILLFLLVAILFLIISLGSVKASDAAPWNNRTDPAVPVAKSGQCPSGYASGSVYCNPNRNAPRCVPKQGQCPSGWPQSGAYCCELSR